MRAVEIIILVTAVCLVVFTVVFNIVRRKKSGGCGGCGSSCSGCNKECRSKNNDKKD